MPKTVFYAGWAFAAGAAIPVMAVLNARLARSLGGAGPASIVLLSVGLATTVIVSLVFGAGFPRPVALAAAPPVLFLGGCVVAAYILSATVLAPVFGVANTVLFVVCAQILTSAVIDGYGLIGVPVRPLSSLRLLGLAVVLAGIVLTQIGAITHRPAP